VSVLIHGAVDGIGTTLFRLGKLAGLEMYGTADQAKHGLVASLGPSQINPEWFIYVDLRWCVYACGI
jgi:NADPH:quinone reductase-like Zn-dependent oxidoreductase